MSAEWPRYAARALALAWACFWLYFGLASGLSERLSLLGVLRHAAIPGGVFLITALIAWRWQAPGAALLILEGLVVLIAYPAVFGPRFPLSTVLFVLLLMAVPPILAGILLLAGGRRSFA
jgi:hypothetical protein